LDTTYDQWLSTAVEMLREDAPDLISAPEHFDSPLTPQRLVAHLLEMVRSVDDRNPGALKVPALASPFLPFGLTQARAVLGRHPLIPRMLPVRAALEARDAGYDPLALVIKLYASTRTTTLAIRGVHRTRPNNPRSGRQLHLELVLITHQGRTILVNTERFGVDDVVAGEIRRARRNAVRRIQDEGVRAQALIDEHGDEAVTRWFAENWGEHQIGAVPLTLVDHVEALLAGAVDAARLIGAPGLYEGVPVVGGQLRVSGRSVALPVRPLVPLVGHDIASVDRMVCQGVMPTLDLNWVRLFWRDRRSPARNDPAGVV